MKNKTIFSLSISMILFIGLLLFFIGEWRTDNEVVLNLVDEKQKGAHVFGEIDSTNAHIVSRNNIEWVALVPWGYQEDYDSSILNHHNGDSLNIRRSDSSWLKNMKLVRSEGFKIFVKPHVWIMSPSEGKWRSDILFWKNNLCCQLV